MIHLIIYSHYYHQALDYNQCPFWYYPVLHQNFRSNHMIHCLKNRWDNWNDWVRIWLSSTMWFMIWLIWLWPTIWLIWLGSTIWIMRLGLVGFDLQFNSLLNWAFWLDLNELDFDTLRSFTTLKKKNYCLSTIKYMLRALLNTTYLFHWLNGLSPVEKE